MTDEIMTIEEVASYLKVTPQTVYKWAQEGQIPGAKLGKEWRFRKSILDEWINTSILHSKAGFDLLVYSSTRAIENNGMTGLELDKIIKEASE